MQGSEDKENNECESTQGRDLSDKSLDHEATIDDPVNLSRNCI